MAENDLIIESACLWLECLTLTSNQCRTVLAGTELCGEATAALEAFLGGYVRTDQLLACCAHLVCQALQSGVLVVNVLDMSIAADPTHELAAQVLKSRACGQ